MTFSPADARALFAALAAIAAATFAYARWLHVSNATTVALTFLLIILLTAAMARLLIAVLASAAAVLCFNFFFLPPVGTWSIADPQNWVALFAFLTVSLVASRLSDAARRRTREATARRNELARLFDLGRDVLTMTAGPQALAILARAIARRFDLDPVAIALPAGAGWTIEQAGSGRVAFDTERLAASFAAARATLEFDAYQRTYAGHQSMAIGGREVRLVPLRAGTRPIGLLAAAGRPIEPGTLDALAGLVAIAIERTQFLEERKAGELTRQSDALKTALLASLAHDLRTPLTAIRVAASNLTAEDLPAADRIEQSGIVMTEVERLARLFDNVLQMARIDAGAVTAEARWAHPSEIVAAARDQAGQVLARHPVGLDLEPDAPVHLDPRLTAAALALLLENAAQYAPPGSPIDVTARVMDAELRLVVLDRGPGVAEADLPHVFDRFYRGAVAQQRPSGTGLGLWIARGLIAAQEGRIWVENREGGGARFTIAVPAATTKSVAAASPDDDATRPRPADR